MSNVIASKYFKVPENPGFYAKKKDEVQESVEAWFSRRSTKDQLLSGASKEAIVRARYA